VDFPQEPEKKKFGDDVFMRPTRPFQKPMESIDFRTKETGFTKAEPKQINFAPPKKLIPLAKRMAETNAPTDNSANANLRVGSVVEHEKFGIGEITAIEGIYPNAKANIKFRDSGEKNLLLKYAKLKVLM
jgi:DNA helicase-2/ATP-dependent DNA helicase PcrA